MAKDLPFKLLEDAAVLAGFHGWTEEVYHDFAACRAGTMSERDFRVKYETTASILIIDMTGFTESAIREGALASLLRIVDVQKVCGQVFLDFGARRVRTFADDFTAVFEEPQRALDAAFEIHHRMRLFNHSGLALPNPAFCCIGLGHGPVLQIGPDLAMGDEMNRTSKLGEDTAQAEETLLTTRFFEEVKHRTDCRFEPRTDEELPFPYYAVTRVE